MLKIVQTIATVLVCYRAYCLTLYKIATYAVDMTTFRSKTGLRLHDIRGTFDSVAWWLSGKALDLRFTGRGFNSRLVGFRIT